MTIGTVKLVAAVGILCLVLLAPLLLVDVPPLLDYPNHLARAVFLAFGASDPLMSQYYATHWAIIPDLGTDLVWPPLMHVLPIYVAGKVVVGCIVVLPVLGTIAYSRAVFGLRSAWPLGSVLAAYNGTLLLGFLNFVAGAGLALLMAAAWIAWRDRYPWRTVMLASVGAVALFFCHLMGLAFCVILVSGHEAAWLWSHRRSGIAMARRVAVGIAVMAGPVLLYAVSPLSMIATVTAWPSLDDKFRELVMPFANYVLPLDITTLGAVVGFLLGCAFMGRCRVTIASGVPLAVLALLFVVAPNAVKGTYLFDTRFSVMFGYLLFGSVLPAPLPRWVTITAVTVFAALFAVRTAVVYTAWAGHRHDVADLRATIASVPPGARVFVATVSQEEAPGYWQRGPMGRRLSLGLPLDGHLGALLLIERRAYWPFMFDDPSQQPIETLPPYRGLAAQADAAVGARDLEALGKVDLCGFTDLLLLHAGAIPDAAQLDTGRLVLVAQTDIAALYRVRKESCRGGG
jgi:hypothetical protein